MIDAHVHVWQIGRNGCTWPSADLPAIHRDFDLDEYRKVAGEDVRGVLLVQSQPEAADTEWLLGLVDPLIAGVVGWADVTMPDAAEQVTALAAHPRLCGLRPMVQDLAADWYDHTNDSALAAMAEARLVLEALIRPRHLDSLTRLARRHPDLTIVIDHAAKPRLDGFHAWQRAIESAARCPNVHLKLSGLVTETAPIAKVVDVLWRAFGQHRLIWGSDWPVLTLAASYEDWLKNARALISDQHHAAIFGTNAQRIYRLP
ncbi:amidohydrolase family protein [Sphingomonas psychrotolerans]|uniref:Amidohydrolase family protein n=1 Tax=Sphingomonas psychrotolerans TaxID=1327635 RepID=A0ABU3MYP1_9SPHN|nr:amidohydrolase family protein [Sphingomonas psychrotolerans]MDT8757425.1 amidohydrolase family protein [Sphingomonas psychrotolerans]